MKNKWTTVSIKLTERQKLKIQKLFEDWKTLYGDTYLKKYRKEATLSSFLLHCVIPKYGTKFYKQHDESNNKIEKT